MFGKDAYQQPPTEPYVSRNDSSSNPGVSEYLLSSFSRPRLAIDSVGMFFTFSKSLANACRSSCAICLVQARTPFLISRCCLKEVM